MSKNFSAKIKRLCDKHGISIRTLSTIGGGAANRFSSSTAERLLKNKLDADYAASLRSQIAHGLQEYLHAQQVPVSQIETELLQIFDRQELKTMTLQKTPLSAEAQTFFGLNRDPFSADPKTDNEVFATDEHNRILAELEDAVRTQRFIALTGEIGSGKDIMLRRLETRAAQSNGEMRLVFPEFQTMSAVSPGSIATAILDEFEVENVPRDSIRRARSVKRLLAAKYEAGVRVALVFNECQDLSNVTLSSLKRFWEMGRGGYTKFLSIVLLGKPKFETRLQEVSFLEIYQRIQMLRMPALSVITEKSQDFSDAVDFIAYRLRVAGGAAEQLFETDALNYIAKSARTPLALGNLANYGLMQAFEFQAAQVELSMLTNEQFSDEPQVRATRKRQKAA